MDLNLKCMEWINMNKNARLIKASNKNKKNPDSENNNNNSCIYLLQIVGYKNNNHKIACLSSDQIVNIYDQQNLKLISQIRDLNSAKNSATNEIGFFKQTDNMLFSCSDDGKLKCWDLRLFSLSNEEEKSNESICFSCSADDKHEFLSADINLNDNLFAVGTNKNIDDALIYIYDIRVSNKYLYKFSESHSNDVNQVKFDPFRASKFCSGSVDGLVCLYDLEQEPEIRIKSSSDKEESSSDDDGDDDENEEDPDFMEQIFNADSSIQKLGYISSTCSIADQLYAITYTNDLFVWDLNTHDVVYKHQSKNKNIVNGIAINVNDDQEEDYFFDCFYLKPNLMTICKGNKNGNIKLYNKENVLFDNSVRIDESNENRDIKRSHRDIIRSSYWTNEFLFTAGEDGFLFKWKLNDQKESSIESFRIDDKQKQKRERNVDNDEPEDDRKKINKKNNYDEKRNKKSDNIHLKNKNKNKFKNNFSSKKNLK